MAREEGRVTGPKGEARGCSGPDSDAPLTKLNMSVMLLTLMTRGWCLIISLPLNKENIDNLCFSHQNGDDGRAYDMILENPRCCSCIRPEMTNEDKLGHSLMHH
jgi:hypothetical protein